MKIGSFDLSATPWWVWLLAGVIVVAGWLGIRWAANHPRHTCETFGPEDVNNQPSWYKTNKGRVIGGMALTLVAALCTVGLLGNIQTSKEEQLSTRNVVLAFDCSRSMTSTDMDPKGKITRVQIAINDTVTALNEAPKDINFGVFCFGAETVRVAPITPDREFVVDAVKEMSVSKEGGTLMGAGVQRALDALAQAGGGMVIVVSDGAEFVPVTSTEKLRFNDAVKHATTQGDIVSTVAYGNAANVNDPPDITLLQKAAANTGGYFAEAQKPGELADALNQVEAATTSQTVSSALFADTERWIPAILLFISVLAYYLLVIAGRE